MHVGRAVIAAHATRELVSNRNAAAANEIGIRQCDRTLLQAGRGHQRLPGRARWITSLDRAIQQRTIRIVQKLLIFGAPFFAGDALREQIRIERGR